MTLATARLLVGRTIVAVDLRPFDGGSPQEIRNCHDPVITLDNGAQLTFSVQETDSGDGYGVRPNYHPKQKAKQTP